MPGDGRGRDARHRQGARDLGYRDDSTEARLLAGDVEALGEVIRWIARTLAAPRFWPIRHQWLDLHQEALTRVIESLRRGRFDPARDFRVYVQAVARYTGFEALDSQRPETPLEDLGDGLVGRAPGQETRLITAGLARLALDQASDECRSLIQAYFYEQRSYAEIAARLGVPVGTVKSRLSRCLVAICRALGRHRRAPGPE